MNYDKRTNARPDIPRREVGGRNEIRFADLGKMYVADELFKKNIDK